jgi:hypothetical protein
MEAIAGCPLVRFYVAASSNYAPALGESRTAPRGLVAIHAACISALAGGSRRSVMRAGLLATLERSTPFI